MARSTIPPWGARARGPGYPNYSGERTAVVPFDQVNLALARFGFGLSRPRLNAYEPAGVKATSRTYPMARANRSPIRSRADTI